MEATLFVGADETWQGVVEEAVKGLDGVSYALMDFSAGGSPTFKFNGPDASLAILRDRVGADD